MLQESHECRPSIDEVARHPFFDKNVTLKYFNDVFDQQIALHISVKDLSSRDKIKEYFDDNKPLGKDYN